MDRQPKISIITVVFNDRDHIENTILSVAGQSYGDIEHIIVDGNSSDGTLDVISKYGDRVILISEPDEGLYDAMNKGLRRATGDYVWYLNSGDQVYDKDTVENIITGLEGLPDIIYGGTMIIDEDQNEIGDRRLKPPRNLNWKSFRQGMVVCHQSVLVKREISPFYNLEFEISADIDWVIRAAKNAHEIYNSHTVISKFLEGGISRNNIRRGLKERFRIMTSFYGFIPTVLRHFLFGIRLTNFYLKHRRI
jgi:glycosyltransferase involved in cell wall biosynthesis